MENIVYWIWLSQACSPGSTTFGKLIKEFNGAKAIYEADGKKIASVIGYRTSDRSALENKNLDNAKAVYDFCKKRGVGIMTYNDDVYPDALRKINDPPVLLYFRGQLPDFDKYPFVSAVGTRRLSDYGRRNAFKIGHDLAKAGVIVVSGMAEGIDGVAMAGALSAGGVTVAIIGSGIDICYPAGHLKLAREIVKRGCVITEYAPGTKPIGHNFPKRNRIISALSSSTIVFEGPERSGALITARCAKEQGKTVYALPGNIGSSNSFVPNLLLKEGAKICTRAEDVLNDLSVKYTSLINTFNLNDKIGVDMMGALHEYEVVAICPSDDIFDTPKPWTTKKGLSPESNTEVVEPKVSVEPPQDFDKKSLILYKRIPQKGSCSIESLVDEETPLRDVMRYILKLEVNGFVRLLPGECVARKFK